MISVVPVCPAGGAPARRPPVPAHPVLVVAPALDLTPGHHHHLRQARQHEVTRQLLLLPQLGLQAGAEAVLVLRHQQSRGALTLHTALVDLGRPPVTRRDDGLVLAGLEGSRALLSSDALPSAVCVSAPALSVALHQTSPLQVPGVQCRAVLLKS